VKVGLDKKTKEKVAIKAVSKKMVEKQETLDNEITILSDITHPHIVKMHAIFDAADTLFIVMELMQGGELYEEIVRRKSFSERDASYVMRQLLEALKYLHEKGIVHRDLKLENLLLVVPNKLDIKLADFGLSKIIKGQALTTACGTPFYVAPDILMGDGYNSAVDLWAAGVLLYVLLSGRLPFAADSDADLFKAILECDLVWKSPQFDNVSDEAKDLIKHLILKTPEQRYTATQALAHPFITGTTRNEQLHTSVYDGLRQVSSLSKANLLKKQQEAKNDSDSDSDDSD
jgi:calcium/calmodulin-dependent protein kinase I